LRSEVPADIARGCRRSWSRIDAGDAIVSRAELLRDVWGYHPSARSRTVGTHMAGLRQKLEHDPLAPRHAVTIRAAGYMLCGTARM
jgi:DNA-binding response OmpR family regulator